MSTYSCDSNLVWSSRLWLKHFFDSWCRSARLNISSLTRPHKLNTLFQIFRRFRERPGVHPVRDEFISRHFHFSSFPSAFVGVESFRKVLCVSITKEILKGLVDSDIRRLKNAGHAFGNYGEINISRRVVLFVVVWMKDKCAAYESKIIKVGSLWLWILSRMMFLMKFWRIFWFHMPVLLTSTKHLGFTSGDFFSFEKRTWRATNGWCKCESFVIARWFLQNELMIRAGLIDLAAIRSCVLVRKSTAMLL